MQPESDGAPTSGAGDDGTASEQVADANEQVQEQRLSTPTREDEHAGGGRGSRGVGATSLQKYLDQVGDTLTPDEDEAMSESDAREKQPYLERVGMGELRAEAQSARDILTMVLDDAQSRNTRFSLISHMATTILASVRELEEQRSATLEYSDAATQTDSCDGLAPLSELRIEDEADMVQLMLLTNRVATFAAQDAGVSRPSTANAEFACPMHAEH